MNVLQQNRVAIGGFGDTTQPYWTSSEKLGDGWTGAYLVRMDGFTGYTGKGKYYPVRCVRK